MKQKLLLISVLIFVVSTVISTGLAFKYRQSYNWTISGLQSSLEVDMASAVRSLNKINSKSLLEYSPETQLGLMIVATSLSNSVVYTHWLESNDRYCILRYDMIVYESISIAILADYSNRNFNSKELGEFDAFVEDINFLYKAIKEQKEIPIDNYNDQIHKKLKLVIQS